MHRKSFVLSRYAWKILTVCTSLGGVLFSCIYARRDGYSHWGRRLLYFTAQSNIWIGITMLLLIIALSKKSKTNFLRKRLKTLYLLRYIFTVSITVTGLVFCGLLAPFADESYHVWSAASVMTHVLAPVFAVTDFFADKTPFPLTRRHIFATVLPPIAYFSLAGVLEAFSVDFGRGVPYPYFFLNFRSPAGIFGFSSALPFIMGTFYWIFLLGGMMLGISALYARLVKDKKTRK